MPTYEYACEGCEHTFEEFQSITAAPLRKCPSCGANKLKRLIGAGGGLIFKGSGFYLTDYRSESYKKSAEAEKKGGESKPTDAKTGDSKSDSSGTKTTETTSKSEKSVGESKPAKKAAEPKAKSAKPKK